MMSYIENTLGKDEEVVHTSPFHWFVWVPFVLWSIPTVLLALIMWNSRVPIPGLVWFIFFFCLWMSVLKFLKWKCTNYIVTNRRVISKTGIFSTMTDEIRNEKVESISIKQGIFGYIFGYGTILFNGSGNTKVRFKYVEDPLDAKKFLEDEIEKSLKKNKKKK